MLSPIYQVPQIATDRATIAARLDRIAAELHRVAVATEGQTAHIDHIRDDLLDVRQRVATLEARQADMRERTSDLRGEIRAVDAAAPTPTAEPTNKPNGNKWLLPLLLALIGSAAFWKELGLLARAMMQAG